MIHSTYHGLVNRLVLAVVLVATCGHVDAHDPNATITWNREISRIVHDRCASCHREGGTSFSLMTYKQVQPRAAAVKDAVLSRRMPPWGGVKGFGSFRNDEGLSQEQISLITEWVETGALRGNNPNALPPLPTFGERPDVVEPKDGIPVTGEYTLPRAFVLDGLFPDQVRAGSSMQITAAFPDGRIEPLLWLYEYRNSYRHPFLFRKTLEMPAGTAIRGVPRGARIVLLPPQPN